MNRNLVAAAIAALVVGFGGGFLTASAMHGAAARSGGPVPNHISLAWPFFGHPRDAGAPRAGETKPDGFAIWKTRLDTSQGDPLACIEMSRDLDPGRSYADFVLVAPDLGHPPAVTAHGDTLCVGGVGFTD